MTLSLQGTGVSSGIAIGPVHILFRGKLDVNEYYLPQQAIENEVRRFQNALDISIEQLRSVRQHIPASASNEIATFIDTHLLMLNDAALSAAPIEIIKSRKCNAEWALKLQRDALADIFEEMNDDYLRTRRDDIDHVVNNILRNLLSNPADQEAHTPIQHQIKSSILIADDLSPADTILMQHQGIIAFVTETGGPTSHTAILARSLKIPAIAGIHNARRYLVHGEKVILDGHQGVLLAGIDETIIAYYKKRHQAALVHQREFLKLRDVPAVTQRGMSVTLYANIELPGDLDSIQESGAEGVGLYRTEPLFMNRATPPKEEEQFTTYLDVVKQLAGKPLTIRTLDLGADKHVDGVAKHHTPVTNNPALGLRAVRLCLKEPGLFVPQLRAILRVSHYGPVRMMIPMLSNVHELQQVLRIVEHTRSQLKREGIAFDPDMPIGGMIEVPAAALSASMFLQHLDFLSIGTNDLIQYTLAIDRVDDEVNYLYDPLHPAVLKLIHNTIQAGKQAKKPVAMCGEMAGEPRFTRLLLGLGLTEFSMQANSILEIKHIIAHSNEQKLQQLAESLLACQDNDDFNHLLEQFNSTPSISHT